MRNFTGGQNKLVANELLMFSSQNSKFLRVAAVLLALLLWEVVALVVQQNLLLVGPYEVAKELVTQVGKLAFWQTIWFSLWRIFSGFFLALCLGVLLAAFSYRFQIVKILLWPYIAVIKSTPVASIIILVLLWISVHNLSVFVSFLIVLPVVYANILEGLNHTDKNLLEMATVLKIGLKKRIQYIYLPQLKPHLTSACAVSIGMAWKAGTAAEVIGIPQGSIGERLYEAKIYLSSSELFAWTVVIIILSMLIEKLFLKVGVLTYQVLWRL